MMEMIIKKLSDRWSGFPSSWRVQAVGWVLFAVAAVFERQLANHDIVKSIILTVFVTPCMIVATYLLGRIYKRGRTSGNWNTGSIPIIVICSLAAALTTEAIALLLLYISGWRNFTVAPIDPVAVALTEYILFYVGWSLAYFWVYAEIDKQQARQRATKAELEKRDAELHRLRLQLDPHFLFNALNGVIEETQSQSPATVSMLYALTAYLRHVISFSDKTIATVGEEVESVTAYLQVQLARFGSRIKTDILIDEYASSHKIACFLLQPLVENAIKYGHRDPVLSIRISITLHQGGLTIEVVNTGALGEIPRNDPRRPSIGVENIRKRLALHYPNRHTFTLEQAGVNNVRALLTLEGEPCFAH